LASDLKQAGANVWVDQENLPLGEIWDTEVEKALKSSDCVLFIATEASVISKHVLNEVYYSLEKGKQVIPVIAHNCEMPLRLFRLNYIDFTKDYTASFQRLLKTLEMQELPDARQNKNGPEPAIVPAHIQTTIASTKESEALKAEEIQHSIGEKIEPAKNEEIASPGTDEPAPNDPAGISAKQKRIIVSASAVILLAVLFLIYYRANKDTWDYNKSVEMSHNTDTATSSTATTVRADSNAQQVRKLPTTAQDYFYAANDSANSGNLNVALAYYTKSIQKGAEFPGVFLNRASTYEQLGQHSKAIADYTKAIQIHPDYGSSYTARGLIYLSLNNKEKACKDFKKAASLDDEEGKRNYNLYCGSSSNSH
jgi:tetratricopeptide (TPR) repeat protein